MKFININKFKEVNFFNLILGKTKRIPWFLGLRAFWVIIFFVILELFIGGFLFYKYAILIINNQPVDTGLNYGFKFKNSVYQKVLGSWQEKNLKFEEYQTEQYSNPFIKTKIKEKSYSENSKTQQGPVVK